MNLYLQTKGPVNELAKHQNDSSSQLVYAFVILSVLCDLFIYFHFRLFVIGRGMRECGSVRLSGGRGNTGIGWTLWVRGIRWEVEGEERTGLKGDEERIIVWATKE